MCFLVPEKRYTLVNEPFYYTKTVVDDRYHDLCCLVSEFLSTNALLKQTDICMVEIVWLLWTGS